jgi:GNAT superfamily N-acetyltransferase
LGFPVEVSGFANLDTIGVVYLKPKGIKGCCNVVRRILQRRRIFVEDCSRDKMMIPREILIEPFRPEDQAAVKALILAGLVEHWGRLDASKNPDLDDIASSYAGGTFLIARLAGQVIGTGALVSKDEKTGQIVRMSVAASQRRRGTGRLILENLLDCARRAGMTEVILETTSAWTSVIEFYKNGGFELTHHRGEDAYFRLGMEAGTASR